MDTNPIELSRDKTRQTLKNLISNMDSEAFDYIAVAAFENKVWPDQNTLGGFKPQNQKDIRLAYALCYELITGVGT